MALARHRYLMHDFWVSFRLRTAAIPITDLDDGSVTDFDVQGWEAAQWSFLVLFDWTFESVNDCIGWFAYGLYNCANLLLVLSPFWAWRLSR